MEKWSQTFFGYRRENGRVGVRNHVVILPVDDISNAAAEMVGNNIKGTLAIPHSYGRLQFGADLELFFRTIIGTGRNPNVAAVVVIGIEPGWTKRVVDSISETGKPVAGFSIEGKGDLSTVAEASRKAQEFVQWATELQREECPISDLWISVKCGESDTTSGLGSNPAVGNLMDKLDPLGVHLVLVKHPNLPVQSRDVQTVLQMMQQKKNFLVPGMRIMISFLITRQMTFLNHSLQKATLLGD
ncbi:MAG: hypothetical protein CM1200mP30_20260 [Pseudomonadota bacterium]|nr:MAG: hypothetical protein CM1200mP30_20260 [Pseudomonadota bacterium]